MSEDELSTREDLENDLQDTQNAVNKLTKPIQDDIKDKIKDEIGDRLSKNVADQGAQEAAKNAAANATSAGAEASGLTGVGGTTAQVAAAQTTAGAGTSIAAGEATAAATAAGGTAAGASVAGGATAGAAAGPIGIAIGAIAGIALGAIKKEVQISPEADSNSSVVSVVIGMACAFFFLIVLCGILLSKGISGMLSIGHTTEFQYDIVNNEKMAPAGEQYLEGYSGGEIEYNYKMPLKNTINMYVYGTENKNGDDTGGDGTVDGFRAALHKAISLHCKNLIIQIDEKSGGINGHWYDSEKSLETFYANQYPYDLATEDFIPRIGDVLHAEEYSQDYQAKYDDVNYAEVIAILSMSSEVEGSNYGFDWGDGNFDDFMRFTQKEECYQNLYELGLKWVPVYVGVKYVEKEDEYGNPYLAPEEVSTEDEKYDSPEECRNAPETIQYDGITCSFDHYYVEVTVKPFGLRELFSMAFGGDPVEAADRMHVNFYEHTNLYMLNYAERVTRLYEREQKKYIHTTNQGVIEVDALGPSYKLPRSEYSSVYEEVLYDEWLTSIEMNGRGRSCWYYIEITYNDEWEQITWPGDPGRTPRVQDEFFETPEGAKLLEMYEYINQGDYPDILRGLSNETVKKSGCLDSSVAMIVMYYQQNHIPITEISKYVGANGQLNTSAALGAYGLTQGSNTYNNFATGVANEIDNNRPVIIHIRGYWESESGTVLHGTTNGHFMVGVGYDETGIYVYDPGKRSNYHIDYEDWSTVGDLYYRPVY